MLRLRSGRPAVLPSPEEAAAYAYTPDELAMAADATSSHVVGDPGSVRRGLDELIASTGADEIMVTTFVHGHEDRLRSYQLVAELACLDVGARRVGTSEPDLP